jgi:Zn-dependent protease with chaperone function
MNVVLPAFSRVAVVLLLAAIAWTAPACAADPPPTAEEVKKLVASPLTAESWPVWRDYYVRLYYATEVGEPPEFYTKIREFMAGIAAMNNGELTGDLAADPVAWINLSRHLRSSSREFLAQSESASRRALAQGDPAGMSSHNLAESLIYHGQPWARAGDQPSDLEEKLIEAERLLAVVARAAPEARLSWLHGLIAWYRNQTAEALKQLRRATDEFPKQSVFAIQYMMLWFASNEVPGPYAETSAKFVERFPEDAKVLAIHAVALYRDERFAEASATLGQARKQDAQIAEFLGATMAKAIDEGRWLTPLVLEGNKLREQKDYRKAAETLRQAIQEQPENVVAARYLARTLIERVDDEFREASVRRGVARECAALCRQFSTDGELEVAHAAALTRAGRDAEASEALDRAERLGVDIGELMDRQSIDSIRSAAESERSQRRLLWGMMAGVAAFLGWLAVMFLLGLFLAMVTPRVPEVQTLQTGALSTRERWLERFYLVILTFSMLVFYLSVPFVVLGLLAITLALLGLMLVVRFIHFGVLYRGIFAIWGVIRSAFIGPANDVFGVPATEEAHPRLFATLREVANRLDTRPVDVVHLTPNSQIGVREEGRGPFGLFRRRRAMQIGVSALSVLTHSEFKSVLAHEYGHFTRQDPRFTRFISQVTASLGSSLAVMEAAAGVVNYINPFYWFYWLYLRSYALLAAGFSRSREFLADRRAAVAYGTETFASGLIKACSDGVLLENAAAQVIRDELGNQRAFDNVFAALRNWQQRPEFTEAQSNLLSAVRQEKPRWYDSHPTFSERLKSIANLPESPEASDDSPALEFLSDASAVEEELTKMLTGYIYDVVYANDEASGEING